MKVIKLYSSLCAMLKCGAGKGDFSFALQGCILWGGFYLLLCIRAQKIFLVCLSIFISTTGGINKYKGTFVIWKILNKLLYVFAFIVFSTV